MADKHDQWGDTLSANHGGWLTGFLADEDKIDRRMLWRLGSWGVAATGAVVIAVLASQSQVRQRRDLVATSDMLTRQAQQIQSVTRENQNDTRRLAQAIEALNGDRDRLYARIASVEQNLDTVTGSIKRPAASAAAAVQSASGAIKPEPVLNPPPPTKAELKAELSVAPPAPPARETPNKETHVKEAAGKETPARETPAKETSAKEAVAATPAPPPPPAAPSATPAVASAPPAAASAPPALEAAPPPLFPRIAEVLPPAKSEPARLTATERVAPVPEPAAPAAEIAAPVQVAAIETAATDTVATPVARTEFGVDIGGANSIDGLRAIWRGTSRLPAMKGLRPIIMIKERATGPGMQLRLVAGPLTDAAAAARICAVLSENKRGCETSVFDGQRLALKVEPAAPEPEAKLKPLPPARHIQEPRKKPAPKLQERTEVVPPKPPEEPTPPPQAQQPPPPPQAQAQPQPQAKRSTLSGFLGLN